MTGAAVRYRAVAAWTRQDQRAAAVRSTKMGLTVNLRITDREWALL